MIYRSVLLLPILFLGACGTIPPQPSTIDPETLWKQRQRQLAAVSEWELTGRLGIHTDHEIWHMDVAWKERLQSYSILLAAPFGQGSIRLEGGTDMVAMTTDEGEIVTATDPGELLWRHFGWRIPFTALRSWILGLPAAEMASSQRLDEYGRLAELQQDGWQIHFLNYREQDGVAVALPRKVFLASSDQQLEIRVVVSDWRPGAPTQ